VIVAGLDGGFASFGWAIADVGDDIRPLALGCIKTKKDARKVLACVDNHKRSQAIARELVRVLELYPDVGVVCAETIAFVRSASVMSLIGRAWGIIDTLCELRGLPLLQASPQEIKAACCPHIKNASKIDVQEALEERFGHVVRGQLLELNKGDREHPADALGSIVACMRRDEMRLARAASRSWQQTIDTLTA
jgi:Holliday junction resolvasome RuvABC endonuclease subunit